MKTKLLSTLCAGLLCTAVAAQDYDKYFCDSTLRVDYTLAGGAQSTQLYLGARARYAGWAGRRHNLSRLHQRGQMQVTMTDAATGDTIYRTSLNPLFTEWQVTEEAHQTQRSMTNVVQLPMPRRDAVVTAQVENYRQEVVASVTHKVSPGDILIMEKGRVTAPHYYVGEHGDTRDRIDIAIVSEGYTQGEMDVFDRDCKRFVEALFSYSPFDQYRDRLNFVAVQVPSQQSGITVPHRGEWFETALGSHYDTFYSTRYLTAPRLDRVADALDGIPYEHIVILANTEEYGGGGFYNSNMLASAHHATFRPVAVHEFGHSFVGLGDEYGYDDDMSGMYPADIEPWEPNITTLVDFDSKWADMVDPKLPVPVTQKMTGTDEYRRVGIFEGGGYRTKGVYRPVQNCRMRVNEVPEFCPVCQREIHRLFDFYLAK